jgi:hypothetical protein
MPTTCPARSHRGTERKTAGFGLGACGVLAQIFLGEAKAGAAGKNRTYDPTLTKGIS